MGLGRVPVGDDPPADANASAGLVVDDITVEFGGLTALDSVSLTVAPNEVVGVIGPNGAGKTTLFNVVCGFVEPRTGVIRYGGRDISGKRPHDLAALGIARTLQGVGLWQGLTVLENVIAGAESTVRVDPGSALLGIWRSSRSERALKHKAIEILERLGIAGEASRLPGALPYALQKRVSLARALISDPSLLLLDEPASGLSISEMDELRALIDEWRASMGVLLVEHHMDLVMAVCERLVVLNFGRVIASGTPEVVRANPEVTQAYLGEEVQTGA